MTDSFRERVLSILMEKNPHRVEENGRGGYRCAADDFEVDWTDRKRIRKHVKGFTADKIIAACTDHLCPSCRANNHAHDLPSGVCPRCPCPIRFSDGGLPFAERPESADT